MAKGKGLRRFVELALDPSSAKRMKDGAQKALRDGTDPKKAKQNLSEVDSAFARLRAGAARIGAAMAGLFALNKIRQFAADSIRAAEEAEAGWSSLANTLSNVGVNVDEQRGRIEQYARAIQDTTRYDDDAVVGAFDRLVQLTGNYEGSLDNLQLTADVAAKRHISLEEAADKVGRAMSGQTRVLREFGITTKDASKGLEQLRERVSGAAAADVKTFSGQVAQLGNAWDNFKEAVGNALIEAGGGTSIMETLTAAVKAATKWVEDNEGELVKWGRTFGDVVKKLAEWIVYGIGQFKKFVGGIELMGAGFAVFLAQVNLWGAQFNESLGGALEGGINLWKKYLSWFDGLPGWAKWLLGITQTSAIVGWMGNVVSGNIAARQRELDAARRAYEEVALEIVAPGVAQPNEHIGGRTNNRGHGPAQTEAEAKKAADALRELNTAAFEARYGGLGALFDTAMRLRREIEQAAENINTLGRNAPPEAVRMLAQMREQLRLLQAEMDRVLAARAPNTALPEGATREAGGISRGPRWMADQQRFEEDIRKRTEKWLDAHEAMLGATQEFAMGVSDAWGDAFSLLFEEGANLQSFFEELGKGMARALLAGLQQYAGTKVAENIALGFENLALASALSAKGAVGKAARASHAAVTNFLAAVKWGAVAGIAGAAGGAIGGGGGGGGYSSRDAGHDTARNADLRGPEYHIYFRGPSVFSPELENTLHGMVGRAIERRGPLDGRARVTVHKGGW